MADPTAAQRRTLAKLGVAMPDGSYYVRNVDDLENAIRAVGRGVAAGDDGDAIRRHIMKRASALNLSDHIPDTWNSDGSLKQSTFNDVDEFLAHFGVKGMKWGVRKSSSSSNSAPSSTDHAETQRLKAKAAKGLHTLSNNELRTLNERLNLEQNHARLANPSDAHSFVTKTLQEVGKQEAKKYATQAAAAGALWITTKGLKYVVNTGSHVRTA